MQIGVKVIRNIVLACSLLLAVNGCALYSSKPVTSAVNSGRLEVGMTPEQVRKVVGKPDEVSKRQLGPGSSREVWTYYEYDPNLRGCVLAFFDSCTACFVPFPPKLQYVVFENEEVIGWNLPDPFVRPGTIEERNM